MKLQNVRDPTDLVDNPYLPVQNYLAKHKAVMGTYGVSNDSEVVLF